MDVLPGGQFIVGPPRYRAHDSSLEEREEDQSEAHGAEEAPEESAKQTDGQGAVQQSEGHTANQGEAWPDEPEDAEDEGVEEDLEEEQKGCELQAGNEEEEAPQTRDEWWEGEDEEEEKERLASEMRRVQEKALARLRQQGKFGYGQEDRDHHHKHSPQPARRHHPPHRVPEHKESPQSDRLGSLHHEAPGHKESPKSGRHSQPPHQRSGRGAGDPGAGEKGVVARPGQSHTPRSQDKPSHGSTRLARGWKHRDPHPERDTSRDNDGTDDDAMFLHPQDVPPVHPPKHNKSKLYKTADVFRELDEQAIKVIIWGTSIKCYYCRANSCFTKFIKLSDCRFSSNYRLTVGCS